MTHDPTYQWEGKLAELDSACGVWWPIETAPRDGTTVLLCDAADRSEIALGFWRDGEWRDRGDIGCAGQEGYEPTHWMPLPEPPPPAP